MFTRNCVVRCTAIVANERYFTVGKTYTVEDNTVVCDNGYRYRPWLYRSNIIEWLSDWYTFELVEIIPQKCEICGAELPDDGQMIDGKTVCNTCMEEKTVFCDCCGRLTLEQNAHDIDGDLICDNCLMNNYFTCDCCGELLHRNFRNWTRNGAVCDCCADVYYINCTECGELIPENESMWDEASEQYLCDSCYDERRNRAIHDYYYKPVPMFYGCNDSLYMGIELEVDKGGENGENAEKLLDIVNATDEHVYIKHDGSLNDGFEIVSHPATLNYHTHDIAWAELMEKSRAMGYRSHDTNTCGLHVHVSRKALGETWEEREETTAKILYFIENNWDNVVKFTRRNSDNLARWACRYGVEATPKDTYEKAKDCDDRYQCVNLLNDNTIEFRIFRGTLKHSTFIATLQFVHALCNMCKNCTDEDIINANWVTFLNDIPPRKYPELVEYLKIRGLYV